MASLYACECGSTSFELYEDGLVRCVGCEDFFTDIVVFFPCEIPGASMTEAERMEHYRARAFDA